MIVSMVLGEEEIPHDDLVLLHDFRDIHGLELKFVDREDSRSGRTYEIKFDSSKGVDVIQRKFIKLVLRPLIQQIKASRNEAVVAARDKSRGR